MLISLTLGGVSRSESLVLVTDRYWFGRKLEHLHARTRRRIVRKRLAVFYEQVQIEFLRIKLCWVQDCLSRAQINAGRSNTAGTDVLRTLNAHLRPVSNLSGFLNICRAGSRRKQQRSESTKILTAAICASRNANDRLRFPSTSGRFRPRGRTSAQTISRS